jgi:5'-nucleotidase (lipoprotein e(P4) family)
VKTANFIFRFTVLLIFAGCENSENSFPDNQKKIGLTSSNLVQNDEQSVLSVLYHQHSAEYRALCIQSYNIAKVKLNGELKIKGRNQPLAVITDLDETALDNSNFYGFLYKNNTTFNPQSNWPDWCRLEKADSIPGSVSFFCFADQKKVNIFYISNRDTSLINSTMNNMKQLGFPQMDKSHFLFKSNSSSKEERRREVAKTYDVVLLLGDNLNDFDSIYESKPIFNRKLQVDKSKQLWGEKFIVFPNSIYGEWENAIYNYKFNLNIHQKDSIRKVNLRSYEK